jgi:hypothetical protein
MTWYLNHYGSAGILVIAPMAITLRTIKILWGRSGNRCAICRNVLDEAALHADDDDSIVGDMAHIVARKDTFTRGDYDSMSPEDRDRYSNLILLCRRHHKVIDDQPNYYTVEKLWEIKASHEEWVRSTLAAPDVQKRQDDQDYAAIIDEWCTRIDIDYWTARGTWICAADGPQIEKQYHEGLVDLAAWLISRIWPHRYPALEAAFFNFKHVLEDFIKVLNRHLYDPTPESAHLVTKRFYKIDEWNREKYDELFRDYDDHVCLVVNLFVELTRAANLICSRVRHHLFTGFRRKEGVLLVQRDMVEGFSSQSYRAEYRSDIQKEDRPYNGLVEFRKHEYDGDYVLIPEHKRQTKN